MGTIKIIALVGAMHFLTLRVYAELPGKDEEVVSLRAEVAKLKAENAKLRANVSAPQPQPNDEAIAEKRKKVLAAAEDNLKTSKITLDMIYSNEKKFPTLKERNDAIVRLRAEVAGKQDDLDQLKKPGAKIPVKLNYPLTIGDVGEIGHAGLGAIMVQIIDKSNAILDIEGITERDIVWVSGLDTSKMIDDKWYVIQGIFKVVGNKTYSTKNGNHTVMHLDRIDH